MGLLELEKLLFDISKLGYRERRRYIRKKVSPPPAGFLYKFRTFDPESDKSVNRTRDIIVQSKLWLSAPIAFNDPFDVAATVQIRGTKQDKLQRIKRLLREKGLKEKEIKKIAPIRSAEPDHLLEKNIQESIDSYRETLGV